MRRWLPDLVRLHLCVASPATGSHACSLSLREMNMVGSASPLRRRWQHGWTSKRKGPLRPLVVRVTGSNLVLLHSWIFSACMCQALRPCFLAPGSGSISLGSTVSDYALLAEEIVVLSTETSVFF